MSYIYEFARHSIQIAYLRLIFDRILTSRPLHSRSRRHLAAINAVDTERIGVTILPNLHEAKC